MPVKNSRQSTKKIKAKPAVTDEAPQEENEDILEPKVGKAKPIEVDIPEPIIGIDEKPEVDPLLSDEETEDSPAEEAGLDDDEVNPFGDKWEL